MVFQVVVIHTFPIKILPSRGFTCTVHFSKAATSILLGYCQSMQVKYVQADIVEPSCCTGDKIRKGKITLSCIKYNLCGLNIGALLLNKTHQETSNGWRDILGPRQGTRHLILSIIHHIHHVASLRLLRVDFRDAKIKSVLDFCFVFGRVNI